MLDRMWGFCGDESTAVRYSAHKRSGRHSIKNNKINKLTFKRKICNQQVVGSTPIASSSKINRLHEMFKSQFVSGVHMECSSSEQMGGFPN